ncbi:family 78 glycoside hydrolase catalytic domain [Tuanshanicoccus lijuaniae]|uniref:family 78 glycoside hydrolase catalytic domain n=1 Tax=Aerococcaceae bacterium zg-1292 TaxID=2774330 RepID=UPI0019360CFC|nr:family 78 glycoside hydrolase catalytic domain [Aerococcaceae bacterium zg-1292]MBF6979118.1 family 78 glycoside hydrolase catalytic domain [Aerococcaceae bacterium zg-BR22]QQA37040.1 family 78 glycoside hydrolase catalytic domain [Aerococcaceae bacterium zg-1292]
MRNNKFSWVGRWISTARALVNEEPEFSLVDMFAGKKAKQTPVEERLNPTVYFKKVFQLNKPIKKAELIVTAQGIYHAMMNGHEVTDAIFTPDYTNYQQFLMYQQYDVTNLIKVGTNVLAVEVADGWYAGRISVQGGSAQFGNRLALLADLVVTFEDEKQLIIGTDNSFTAGYGKHVYADIQIGEKQDLRLDTDWQVSEELLPEAVFEIAADYTRLTPQEGPMVYRQERLDAQKIWLEDTEYIVDFGQVIAGRVRLTVDLAKDQEIIIEHSEVLDETGRFFRNIVGRNKDARDIFIGRGQKEVLEPDFTFHGFRYVKITGLTHFKLDDIKAIAIYSQMETTGYFKTNDAKMNRLLSNILWSQKGNMLSIPTDCPQRERVGWTGDMQVFASASTFFMNSNQLIQRWLKTVRIDQRENGAIVDYSPEPLDAKNLAFTGVEASAGWGDAIIMVPWTLYQRYGNKEVLIENYEAMKKWFVFEQSSAAGDKEGLSRYIWDTQFHYGDWMFPSFMMKDPNPMKTAAVTKDLVATAFLAHSAELLAQIAEELGDDGQSYRDYAANVKAAFTQAFVTETGYLTADYQGCYVLALAFKMVPLAIEKSLVKRLVALIEANGRRLDTGFLSVPYLLDVLSDYGYVELAKAVFLQDECPSWFYEVDHGATTIWESWAAIQPDGTVEPFSFNHYAFGCVLDWMVREIAGLKNTAPGYEAIEVSPSVEIVDDFELCYQSATGLIKIIKRGKKWMIQADENIEVVVDLNPVQGKLVRNLISSDIMIDERS